jgi:hypothetical protein
MEKKRKTTTLRLSEEDIKAILAIRMQYGLASDNQAIIFAIRTTANHLSRSGEGKG